MYKLDDPYFRFSCTGEVHPILTLKVLDSGANHRYPQSADSMANLLQQSDYRPTINVTAYLRVRITLLFYREALKEFQHGI